MIDYAIYRRSRLDIDAACTTQFDLYLSAYERSDRVVRLFDWVDAKAKKWISYEGDPVQPPDSLIVTRAAGVEVEALKPVIELIRECGPSAHVGVDITGMHRPHIAMLLLLLTQAGIPRIEVFYTDPQAYLKGADTVFSIGGAAVFPLPGFHGPNNFSLDEHEALIIGVGYDQAQTRAIAESKKNADHYLLMPLPSLQPHMYQESHLGLADVSDALRSVGASNYIYAPAADPFATAQVLSERVGRMRKKHPDLNLYLAPIGPKPQVLGMALFMLAEQRGQSSTLLAVSSPRYPANTSVGIARAHQFSLELDLLPDPLA